MDNKLFFKFPTLKDWVYNNFSDREKEQISIVGMGALVHRLRSPKIPLWVLDEQYDKCINNILAKYHINYIKRSIKIGTITFKENHMHISLKHLEILFCIEQICYEISGKRKEVRCLN